MDLVTVERTFNVSAPAWLTLLNVTGALDLQGADGDSIEVVAVKHPGRGFDRTQIEMEQAADGAVRVATKFEDDVVSRLLGRRHNEPCRVDYTVRVPRQCALDISYVSGPAYVAGVSGAITVGSVDGALDVADLGGAVELKTVSGDLRAVRLNLDEPLLLETVSAEVFVGDSRLPGLRVSTASGDVHVESHLATGAYHINTVSGDVFLRLPAGTQGTVHLSSLSGNFHSDLPGLQRRSGGEGVALRVSSVSGDITLASDGPAPTLDQPTPGPDRLAVLDRIASGEMSVDEALKNLKA